MNTIEELYYHYRQKRKISLNLEQFTLLVEFFPSLLVVLSDGVVDSGEQLYLDKLVQSIVNIFALEGFNQKKTEELYKIYSTEFDYIIQNIDDWKKDFLRVLRNYLEVNPEQKEMILDTLHLFAETSQDVTDIERGMILRLKRELNL